MSQSIVGDLGWTLCVTQTGWGCGTRSSLSKSSKDFERRLRTISSLGIISPPWWAVCFDSCCWRKTGSHCTFLLRSKGRTTLRGMIRLDWSSKIQYVNASPTLWAIPTQCTARSRLLGHVCSLSRYNTRWKKWNYNRAEISGIVPWRNWCGVMPSLGWKV